MLKATTQPRENTLPAVQKDQKKTKGPTKEEELLEILPALVHWALNKTDSWVLKRKNLPSVERDLTKQDKQ